MKKQLKAIRKVLKNHRAQLLNRANIVAVGIGYKITNGKKTSTLGIVCSVSKKIQSWQLSNIDRVPTNLNGILTDVIETGIIHALRSPTERHRPAPGGVSVGHRNITAGTLGCLVKKEGKSLILSNNHILANSNDAKIGDPILQPGPHDGGHYPEDHIANLEEFIHINIIDDPSDCPIATNIVNFLNKVAKIFKRNSKLQAISQAGINLVDAAIARPLNPEDVENWILRIGAIQGIAEGELGMAIQKSGRTTGLTAGKIQQIDVTVNVQYGEGKIAQFTDQLMAGAISQGGDSGSAILDENNNLVGLLFAGSDTSTIMNRIQNVFNALDVSL